MLIETIKAASDENDAWFWAQSPGSLGKLENICSDGNRQHKSDFRDLLTTTNLAALKKDLESEAKYEALICKFCEEMEPKTLEVKEIMEQLISRHRC